MGDVVQTLVTQVFFSEVTSRLANAFPVEGSWKESQDNFIDFTRIALDLAFVVGGVVSLTELMKIITER